MENRANYKQGFIWPKISKFGREQVRYSRTNGLPWPPEGVGVKGGLGAHPAADKI